MVFIKGSGQSTSKKSPGKKLVETHPYQMILYLAILASSMLFLFILIAYTATDSVFASNKFSIPKPFILGSFFIVFSSFSIAPCVEYFRKEDVIRIQKSLRVTIILAMAFIICQYLGWREMLSVWGDLGDNRSATYLYILSGLHGLHYLGGTIALIWINLQWYKWGKDDVKTLIAITNPFEELKIQLMTIYWHFLDILWLFVFLFFLFFIY